MRKEYSLYIAGKQIISITIAHILDRTKRLLLGTLYCNVTARGSLFEISYNRLSAFNNTLGFLLAINQETTP